MIQLYSFTMCFAKLLMESIISLVIFQKYKFSHLAQRFPLKLIMHLSASFSPEERLWQIPNKPKLRVYYHREKDWNSIKAFI